ncbi:MAG TPA: acylphosphatase [Gammaproteobacteria bacterium]|nr:acylphosphatase [Gammaproteobacteria bacterium]
MGCIQCRISGRVQGVFFRDSTRRIARQLGLRGSAVNLPDGSVQVVACGEQQSIEVLKNFLSEGPSRARVDQVSCEAVEIEPPPGFRIG